MRNVKIVGYDNLAPLLLLDKQMEETPEPFRMQKDVLLVVSFSEYLKFIDVYLNKVDYLSTPTFILKRYRATQDTNKLYVSFLKDMAYCVAKELHYAETYNKSATCFMHTAEDSNILSLQDVEKMYKDIRSYTEQQLRDYMSARDFSLPKFFREENMSMWHYANILLFFSMAPGNRWILKREELTI